ncbi:MAG: cobalamin-dependent protein [Candidatus Hodarchaeaceae archaeon]|nr:cobalamin-dependent protein [Candidatus Hodarchaeaceae archaeon]
MPMAKILREIERDVSRLDYRGLLEDIDRATLQKIPAQAILRGLSRGMMAVGGAYEKQEIFLPEVLIAAEMFERARERLAPKLPEGGKLGKVVIGTVGPDVHDIGKNLVATWLRAAGFEVVDVGVFVSPETFVKAVERHKADIAAMSLRLSTAIYAAWRAVGMLEARGLRKNVKVIIGGSAASESLAHEMGADAHAAHIMQAVRLCKKY